MWQETHIVLNVVRPCSVCHLPTRFAMPDFEVMAHPGACTEWWWGGFDLANITIPAPVIRQSSSTTVF